MIVACFVVLIVIAATLIAINRAIREQSNILVEVVRKLDELAGNEWRNKKQ